MNILSDTQFFLHSCRSALASAALLAAVAVLGSAGGAVADLDDHTHPCIQNASGQPHLNCTANDMAIAGMVVTNQLGDCKTNPEGVWSFDGTITVGSDTTTRYDLGMYIGYDGIQALVGENCWVDTIEEGEPGDTWFDNDGDLCGDHPSGVDVTLALHNVTVTCADVNADGDADIPVCVSYDNNSDTPCNTETDAIPANDAKCQCFVVNTGVHIGCETNTDCAADATPCTAAVCLGPGEPGTNLLGCIQQPVAGSCDDGLFCNGSDECTDGACVHSGDPCESGGVCEACNESADNCFVAAGTPCRAAEGICDVAENCTGEAVDCPVDTFVESDTVCRASAGVCDPAEHCTGESADCPVDLLDASDVVCRAVSGICDVAEHCTGQAAGCPADAFLAPAVVCRGSAGICDVAENCTGQAAVCPPDGFAAPQTVCRASEGICDLAENCTGAEAGCPGDGFVSSATTCRASAGVCDPAENCTGSDAACPANVLTSTDIVCRAANGVCDVAENCTAASAECPADVFVSSATTCRTSAGVCDPAENCTGQAADCPADILTAGDVVCRASGGVCDVAESCTGAAADCPADAFVSSATTCRATAGVCDPAENCTGTAADCPADVLTASDVVCRASGGVCDVAEYCTAAAAGCPDDAFLSSETLCRASAGICDPAENCTGSAAACPADAFVASDTVCRAPAGVCDVAENCTGSAAACPADAFVSSATACRASAGVCDVAESCTGATAACPADAFVSSATTCRASAGVCDVAENCTGAAAACPANGFQPSPTACTTDGNVCTNDVCDGAGNCQHPNNTAPCDDGLFCTVTDTCAAGSCGGSERNCSDGTGCTVDSCNEEANACQSIPDDGRCVDEDACTIDTCDAQTGCAHLYACKDICRDSGFWGKRGGDGNVTQELLDALGGLEVCGQSITETSVNDSVAGLGLSSALEGLCVRVEGIPVRSLYRELVTTALNCGISGSSDCDQVVAPFIDVAFSTCDSLCAGDLDFTTSEDGESLEATCIRQLSCYNRGGRLIDGRCAYGTCDVTDELCGGDHGACPPVANVGFPILQVCERFPDNCRDSTFCQEALGVCPDRLPASSTRACREAKTNACTIDECSVDPD